jgi:hypothetical protein
VVKELRIQVTTYKGHRGVDIRYYLESPEFTGPTQKGVWISVKDWEDFKKQINELDIETKK